MNHKEIHAYVVGIAIGDGNLSNPNGRPVRLRVSCDIAYPLLIQKIISSIQIILPGNKVSIVQRKSGCVDVSCYSNRWPELLGWNVGDKMSQNVGIPQWIRNNKSYSISCLRGLI